MMEVSHNTTSFSAVPAAGPVRAAPLRTLVALKLRLLRNSAVLGLRRYHWRVILGGATISLLCYGLFALLAWVLEKVHARHLESAIAIEYIFHFFFIAVMAMLWISATLLGYAALFGREEPVYLLVGPLEPWHVVFIKLIESFVLSSWSLLLLGLPFLAAMGRTYTLDSGFYPMFAVAFLAFALIPVAWGMLTAYVAARWLPRQATTKLLLGLFIVATISLAAVVRYWHPSNADYARWLGEINRQMRLARAALLPSTWMSRVALEAGAARYSQAGFYLFVLLANALFFSYLAVRLVSQGYAAAIVRVQDRPAKRLGRPGLISAAFVRGCFFWLPRDMQEALLKDIRYFTRDASQWSQAAVLVGLMILYVLNMPRLDVRVLGEYTPVVVPFLNLAAISLILATFTGRFIFPQVSLEGRHLWILFSLPVERGRAVISKFIMSLTVTLAIALSVLLLSAWSLKMSPLWAAVQISLGAAMCVGLCGLAVGFGAWLPSFEEKEAAKIASGLGGMLNLLASLVWVAFVNAINAIMCKKAFGGQTGDFITFVIAATAVAWLVAILIAAGTLKAGMRSLQNRQI